MTSPLLLDTNVIIDHLREAGKCGCICPES